jgi:F0F1-type ATP synthase assembly protein I
MNQPNDTGKDHRYALNLTIIGVFGQVGFLTLFIILAALLGGLWLDKMFDSKPLFTIILMIASVPVSLVLMYKIVMWATSRIKPDDKKTPIPQEDLDRDR